MRYQEIKSIFNPTAQNINHLSFSEEVTALVFVDHNMVESVKLPFARSGILCRF